MSREDAAFFTYDHGCMLVWQTDDKMVRVYKNGAMRIHLTQDNGEVAVLRYVNDLDEYGLDTDEKLFAAEKSGKIEWHENPWFEVVWSENEEGEVLGNYDEAVAYALKVRKGDL
jgi:hypothetical protein